MFPLIIIKYYFFPMSTCSTRLPGPVGAGHERPPPVGDVAPRTRRPQDRGRGARHLRTGETEGGRTRAVSVVCPGHRLLLRLTTESRTSDP